MTTKELDHRVKLGIEFLDLHYKGWRKLLDLEVLDLKDPCNCVLGELSGRKWEYGDFFYELYRLDLTKTDAANLGFSLHPGEGNYRALTEAWKRALR